MCGICGFTGIPDETLIDRMTDIMAHRGPDDRGVFNNNEVSLGHRRLSIIDLAGGRQPMFNEDGSICIVYNGEIYNYLDLKKELEKKGHRFKTKSDTEVIIHLYEDMGTDCVQKLNGMFAFGIWDNKRKRLFLARDRLGIKPLYYIQTNKRFLFASEIKSLLQYEKVHRKVNYNALNQLLSFSFVSGNETMFKGIHRLFPAHILTSQGGKIKIKRYWKYEPNAHKEVNEKKIMEQIYEILKDSITIRLMSEVPLGATLSGGLDSSATVGLMCRALDRPVRTFSVGFNEPTDELPYARIVANHFKTEHKEYLVRFTEIDEILPEIIWHMEEPIPNGAIIPTYFYSRAIKDDTTVTLIGEGSDELFAGYRRFKYMSPFLGLVPNKIKHYAYLSNIGSFSEGQKKHLFTHNLTQRVNNSKPIDDYYKYFANRNSNLDNSLTFEIEKVLPEYHLMRIDKLTMCHSLEARVPFLDFRLVELSSRIHSSLKLKGFEEKYILRKALNDLLPQEILNRRKLGLNTPVNAWFEKGLRRLVDNVLEEKKIRTRGLFRKEYIDHLLKKRDHPIWGRQYKFHILRLVFIELWFDIFIDDCDGRFNSKDPRESQVASPI